MTADVATLAVPTLIRGLCDDAAIFPPGLKPLPDAVVDHGQHLRAPYAPVVGPLVLSTTAVQRVHPLVRDLEPGSLPLVVVGPLDELGPALTTVTQEAALRLVAVEAPTPDTVDGATGVAYVKTGLAEALGNHLNDIEVFIEIPRDERRPATIDAIRRVGWMGKLRTGGVRAELYPDEQELAEALIALVRTGVACKATAGLHHAIRNTDPERGFEQHGFLNVLWAVDSILVGAGVADVRACLAERDGPRVAEALGNMPEERATLVRDAFRSFGTCSIIEPVEEMTDLGLLPS